MATKWVNIKHPKLKLKARVALSAFEGENGLAKKGWQLDDEKGGSDK